MVACVEGSGTCRSGWQLPPFLGERLHKGLETKTFPARLAHKLIRRGQQVAKMREGRKTLLEPGNPHSLNYILLRVLCGAFCQKCRTRGQN